MNRMDTAIPDIVLLEPFEQFFELMKFVFEISVLVRHRVLLRLL